MMEQVEMFIFTYVCVFTHSLNSKDLAVMHCEYDGTSENALDSSIH